MGHRRGEEVGKQIGDRYAEAADGVDELGGHPVACGEKAVLGERLLGVHELGLREALLELQSAHGLHERAEGARGLTRGCVSMMRTSTVPKRG